ncbi:hypothetical protein O4H49_15840 [Kiloniella laminariae]|uniref:ACT domain-containing protein n=1 Tax=Kiloniella laminariae TaxID=454162 RepID=A0ABT4LMA5_9PROT|nr:hypothetical protein [Kiloniella laminariae]MCZ4282260.1 hypothetical protein [Kiloniella laminariae]
MSKKPVATYQILAESEPGTLPRILELFALNSSVPFSVVAMRAGEETQRVVIETDDLTEQRARIIEAKLKAVFTVYAVSCSFVPHKSQHLVEAFHDSKAAVGQDRMALTA